MDFIRDVAFPPAVGDRGADAADIDRIKTWPGRLAAYLGGAVDGRDNITEARGGLMVTTSRPAPRT